MSRRSRQPEPPFATTDELVEITHVERQTLRQWVRRGLLPKPKIVSDGNGVKSRWPRSALERARFVTEMRAQLYSLDEIVVLMQERLGIADEPAIGAKKADGSDKTGVG